MSKQDVGTLIAKLQEQINSIDKKVDLIMGRVMSTPVLMAQNSSQAQVRPKEKLVYDIICAECGKESTLPFKPNSDRPVYCKECFSRRRQVGHAANSSHIRAEDRVVNHAPTIAPTIAPAPVKAKKKTVSVKKAAPKRKTAPKKK